MLGIQSDRSGEFREKDQNGKTCRTTGFTGNMTHFCDFLGGSEATRLEIELLFKKIVVWDKLGSDEATRH